MRGGMLLLFPKSSFRDPTRLDAFGPGGAPAARQGRSARHCRPDPARPPSPMTRVLLVDDDADLNSMLAEYLGREGFETASAFDGDSGVARALAGDCALVVLDMMMPGINGIEALRRIRAASCVPALILTSRGDDIDRIVGLELGADDYVPKPCTLRELVARIRAILRRVQASAADGAVEPLAAGALRMWPRRRHAEWAGAAPALTSTEFSLLEVLLRRAGSVVSKAELSEQALSRPLARFDRSIDVHLSSIRHKSGRSASGESPIRTVRGLGYQLAVD